MKSCFKLAISAVALISAAVAYSCKPAEKNDPEPQLAPSVKLEQRSVTMESVTFNMNVKNASEAAYILLNSGDEFPSAEAVFSNGVAAKADSSDYTIDKLTADTEYRIAAAAKSEKGEFSSVAELKFKTQAENPDESKVTFEVFVTDVNHASAKVSVIPSDEEVTYAALILPSEQTKNLSDEELFNKIIDQYKADAEQNGVTFEEVLKMVLQKGTLDGVFNNLKELTEYEVVVFALDLTGTLGSDLNRQLVTTTELKMSDITFDIKVPEEEITATTVHVTITPSNLEERFVWLCQATSTYPGNTAREIAEDYVKKFGNMLNVGMGLYSGVQDYANYEVMSGTEYFIVVFAYNSGITSEPQMITFKTKDGADVETFDCTFNIKGIEAHKVKLDVTPNDNSIFYVCGASEEKNFNIDEIKANIEAEIKQYYEFQHNFNPNYSMAMAVEGTCSRGALTDRIIEPLNEQTSYKLFAFGVTLEGKASEKYVVSEPFTTPEFIISDAKVVTMYYKEFDGDAAYEKGLFDGQDTRGKAIVAVEFDSNDKVAEAYHGILYGDYGNEQSFTDEALWSMVNWVRIDNVVDNPYEYYLTDWDVQVTAFAAAKDANGIWGPVSRAVFTPAKSNVSPIDELVEMLQAKPVPYCKLSASAASEPAKQYFAKYILAK